MTAHSVWETIRASRRGPTAEQLEVIDYYKAFNVPAMSWFISPPEPDGSVEAIGLAGGFLWSLRIDVDGDYSSSEATVGEFSTGIEV